MGILLWSEHLCWWQALQGHCFQFMALFMNQFRLTGQVHWQSHVHLPSSINYRNMIKFFHLVPLQFQISVMNFNVDEKDYYQYSKINLNHIDGFSVLQFRKANYENLKQSIVPIWKIFDLQYSLSKL